MCNADCIIFTVLNLTRKEVENKQILDMGCFNVNGSVRPFVESLKPKKYVGVDIKSGLGVDIVCKAEDTLKMFGKESFDVVLSTDLLEHVNNWRAVVSNMKNLCKPNGVILATTCMQGFQYHGYPYDFWRYSPSDMQQIFFDCELQKMEKNDVNYDIFIKVKKPTNFVEKDLLGITLYSIIEGRRVKDILPQSYSTYIRHQLLKDRVKKQLSTLIKHVLH